ncbi:transporter substrate-binding domain-containing protein [Desulfovibrio legallii]|jgi:polar amino acid transport system substrate-binding protein|uniref:Amino acid ABC transporter substrate-binding protein, PAAT family n=1 Tax=Desulfovibrio legallii TaxID=571438 RepID=A0A1G7QXF1_9BACT|nr:transporter substrate-binding domain-containing protein [Desulfovibrio legallii]SDG02360.1 amino acid ABC transporter substrate-binding protein, PAAT family [Desulfovibrio legallii]
MNATFRHIAAATALACAVILGPQAAKADLLADVKAKGEIVIGTEARYAPFEYMEDGKIVGYSADLLALIMKDMPGVKVKRVDIPFQGILPGLSAKKFDYIVTSVTATKERYARYALSVPIADATVAMLVRADSPCTKPEDLLGKTVGSQTGSAQIAALRQFAEKMGGKDKIKAKEYVAFDEAYADLAAGRLDGVAQSFPNLADVIKRRPGVFKIITPPFGPKVYFSWAGRKDADSASLVAFFDEGLRKLMASGKMKELQQKWFGFSMDVPTTLPVPVQ